jgi:hypothetical protein
LTLYRIRLRSEEACRALGEAEVQYLDLKECILVDGGAILVESGREGRGPRGFRFQRDDDDGGLSVDSSQRYISFLNALGGNSYLERLDLENTHVRDGIPQALTTALREN